MDFKAFSQQITKVKKMELPGEAMHFDMAPIERLRELKQQARAAKQGKLAAVLCLFYPDQHQQTHFMLILRKTYHGVHSAQVGFPGGKPEPEDPDLIGTALRESWEEVGVRPEEVQVLKELTEIYIPPSRFFVRPFMGIAQLRPNFVKQDEEVEAMIEVPLQELMAQHSRITQQLSTSYAKTINVPAFKLQEHIVWGATAMMLNEVREMIARLGQGV